MINVSEEALHQKLRKIHFKFFARNKSNWACIAEFQIFALNLVAVGCNMIFSPLQNYKATTIRGIVIRGGRVVRCRTCDREVVVRIPPAAAVYQCQLSVPSLRGRLMSTSESWGVNGHTMRCTGPVSVVLRLCGWTAEG